MGPARRRRAVAAGRGGRLTGLAAGTAPRLNTAPLVMPLSVTVGAVVSTTVTVKVPVAVLLRLLVAEQVTVVAPNGNCEPDAGVQVTTTFVSFASVAVALKVTTAPAGLVASAVMLAGSCRTGGVGSGRKK